MARSSWAGAIVFAGFPIEVTAYNLLKSKSSDSFKTLCDCHKQPIRAPKVCATSGGEVPADKQLKGVQVAPDQFIVVDTTMMEAAAGRSATIEPSYFAPVATITPHLATGVYRLNPGAPAHAKSVAVLWATLHKLGLAMVADDWTTRSGSRDTLVAIYATTDGLTANTLPFTTDLSDAPAFDAPTDQVQDAETAMFTSAIDTLYKRRDFDRSAHASAFNARRAAAVEAAMAGQPVQAVAAAAPAAVPDLMAALQASLDAVKGAPSITPTPEAIAA